MALFLFLISLFGLLSALRILSSFHARALITTSAVTKTGTAICTTLTFSVFLSAHNAFFAFLLVMFTLIVSLAALWSYERRQIDALKSETPHFIDRWILNMRLGNSLSAAREAALDDSSTRARTLLRPLFINSAELPRAHLFLPPKILNELKLLANSPHSALARLENIRETLRQADEFRRKSGQARRQTSIQSLVLLLLHLALAIFTIHRYGWQRHSDLVVLSFVLAGGSVAAMQRLARKTTWTI